jgi:hypothetical protein
MTDRVAQGVGPEFKLQHCKNNKIKKKISTWLSSSVFEVFLGSPL